jgi:hypothetical protein
MTQNQRKWIREPLSLLDKIADRAAHLLMKESDDPQAEMRWAEDKLMEANLFNGNPDRKNPQQWAEEVIAQNDNLADESLPWIKERDLHPEKAETFENLILSLIPTEGGL